MSVIHSTEDIASALQTEDPFCNICNEVLNRTDLIANTPCKHTFHKHCILEHLNANNKCHVCNLDCTAMSLSFSNNTLFAELRSEAGLQPSANESLSTNDNRSNYPRKNQRSIRSRGTTPRRGIQTRSTTRQELGRHSNETFNNPGLNNPADLAKYIQDSINIQQTQLVEQLTSYLSKAIETSVQTQLAALKLNLSERPPSSVNDINSRTISAHVHQPQVNNPEFLSDVSRTSPNQSTINSNKFSGKVPNIMQSWHIKFDGSKNCMQMDEFIYRVRSLTRQNLNDDYKLLCDHLYLLFAGKANDWY